MNTKQKHTEKGNETNDTDYKARWVEVLDNFCCERIIIHFAKRLV